MSIAVACYSLNQCLLFVDTPGEVRGLSLKVVDGGFDLSWQVPRCKGKSGIKEYRISQKKAGASSWKESVTTTQLTFKMTNLEEGADYTIGVAVIGNNKRVGTYSELTQKATNVKGNLNWCSGTYILKTTPLRYSNLVKAMSISVTCGT